MGSAANSQEVLWWASGGGLTVKYGGQVGEKTHISIGGIAAMDFFGELDRPLAIGFVNFTRGDNNKNWSLNLGLGNRIDESTTSYDWSSYTVTTSSYYYGSDRYIPAGQSRTIGTLYRECQWHASTFEKHVAHH